MKTNIRNIVAIFAVATLGIILVTYFIYFQLLKNQSRAYIDGWVQSELTSLQQGNVLSSIMKIQRNIVEGTALRGAVLFESVSGRASIELGQTVPNANFLKTDRLYINEARPSGIFGTMIGVRLSENYTAYFLVEPRYAAFYFFLNVFSLLLLLIGAVLFTIWNARTEGRQSEALLKRTIEQFVANETPSALLKSNYPSLVERWAALRAEMERISSLNVELRSHSRLAAQAKQVKHDLGSPISLLRVISQKTKSLPPEHECLLRSALDRIDGILATLETKVSTISDSLMSRVPLPLMIERVRSDKLFEVEYASRSKTIEILIKSAGSYENKTLRISHVELGRALNNLLNNAIESCAKSIRIEISTTSLTDGIEFAIKDNGPGISPEILTQLRSQGGTFGKPGGTGLGLGHLKETLNTCGSKFQIDSRRGETVVSFFVPYACIQNFTCAEPPDSKIAGPLAFE